MKKATALLLALLMTASLCACGSSSKSQSSARVEEPAATAMYAAAYDTEAMYEDAVVGVSSTSGMAELGETANTAAENPEKIIYSADATVETTDFDKTIADLGVLIEQYGAWVESSSINDSSYYNKSRGNVTNRSASYCIRIPCESFSTIMTSLTNLGSVPYSYTYTENVTAKYYDTQARMKAYQAQEERLIEMLEIAETVEDIITIEDKLSDVRYSIDSLQSALKNWDRRVSYSSINLTVKEVQIYTPTPETKVSYGQRLVNAFVDAVEGVGEFLQDLLVFIVSAIPTLVILVLLFFILRPLFTRLLPRLKEKHAQDKAKKAEKKAAKKAAKDNKTE